MTNERDEWIKRRAYALWELAGRPHGQDGEHWLQASAEFEVGAPEVIDSIAGARVVNDFPTFPANVTDQTACPEQVHGMSDDKGIA